MGAGPHIGHNELHDQEHSDQERLPSFGGDLVFLMSLASNFSFQALVRILLVRHSVPVWLTDAPARKSVTLLQSRTLNWIRQITVQMSSSCLESVHCIWLFSSLNNYILIANCSKTSPIITAVRGLYSISQLHTINFCCRWSVVASFLPYVGACIDPCVYPCVGAGNGASVLAPVGVFIGSGVGAHVCVGVGASVGAGVVNMDTKWCLYILP